MGYDVGAITSRIELDVKDLKSQLNNAQKEMKGMSTKGSASITALTTSFLALDAVARRISQAFKMIGGAAAEWVGMANEQETSNVRLTQTLKNIGEYSKEAVDDIKDMAMSLQDLTGIDNKQIEDTAILLLNLGVPRDQLEDAVNVSLNLSAALGMDLNSATRNVGKTMGGFAGELGEVIPELKGLSQEQLKAGEGIKILDKKYADFSKALQSTVAVQLQRARAHFDDLKKAIGEGITESDLFRAVIQKLGDGLRDLAQWATDNKQQIASWADALIVNTQAAVQTAVAILGALGNAYLTVKGVIQETASSMTKILIDLLDKARSAAVALGMGAAATKLHETQIALDRISKNIDKNITETADRLENWKIKIDGVQTSIENYGQALRDNAAAISKARKATKDYVNTTNDAADADNKAAEAAAKRAEAAAKRAEAAKQVNQLLLTSFRLTKELAEAEHMRIVALNMQAASMAEIFGQAQGTLTIQLTESTEELGAFLEAQTNQVTTFWETFAESVGTYTNQYQNTVNSFISNGLTAWGNYWQSLGANTDKGSKGVIAAFGAFIGEVASQFGQFMVAHGIATIALALTPVGAAAGNTVAAGAAEIAAGLALTALGGFMKGSASLAGGGGGAGAATPAAGGGTTGPGATQQLEERNQRRYMHLEIHGNILGQAEYIREQFLPELNAIITEDDATVIVTNQNNITRSNR